MTTPDSVQLSGMTRRQALRRMALTSAAVLLAGCRPSEPIEDEISDVFDVTLLQQLLDRRAKAQMEGDEEAYLADLDASNEKLIQRERLVFANLRQFAVDDLRFVTERYVGPAIREQSSYQFVPVSKVIKLSADAAPGEALGPSESFEYVVTRRDDSWVVTDVVPLTMAHVQRTNGQPTGPGHVQLGIAWHPANAPWNQTPLQVINVGNVTLAADDSVTDLQRYARVAEAEAQRVEALWGDRPRFPGHVLFFTRRKKAMRKWYEYGTADITAFREGFTYGAKGIRGTGEAHDGESLGSRIVIYLPGIEELGRGPRLTLRHELVHSMTRRAWVTGDNAFISPAAWAVEGFATFIEARGETDLEQQLRAAAVSGFAGSLPITKDFQKGADVFTNYAVSYTVFRFIEQLADLETAIDYYAEVVKYADDIFDSGGLAFAGTPRFDEVCQQVVGMDGPEFLGQWAAFVQAGA